MEGQIGGEPAGVIEQHADGHPLPASSRKAGQIPRHRRIQLDHAAIHQHHHRAGRRHHLGERRQIPESRSGRRDGSVARPGQMPESAGVEHLVPTADHHHRPRIHALPDAPLDQSGNAGVGIRLGSGDGDRGHRGKEKKRDDQGTFSQIVTSGS